MLLPKAPTLALLRSLLGPPSRTEDKANRAHFYDELGLFFLEPYDGNVVQISVVFEQAEPAPPGSPRGVYEGTVQVSGHGVSAATRVEDVAALAGASFRPDAREYVYDGATYDATFRGSASGRLSELTLSFTHPRYNESKGPHPKALACEGGNALACSNIGASYLDGTDVVPDFVRGARYASKGCDGGDPMGCVVLAMAYAEGRGVPVSKAKSQKFLRKACEGGLSHPQCAQ